MNFRSFSALASSFITLGTLFIAGGCSDDDNNAGNGTSSSSGGTSSSSSSSSGSSGTPGTSSGDGGGDGGSGGAFWFISDELPKVGSSDLSGAEKFSDDIEGKPIGITVGGGAAWVITDGGKLLRYDLNAPVHATPIDVAKHPSHVVFAAGSVWVTEDDDGSGMCDDVNGSAKLLRFDPATSTVTKKIPVTATTVGACNHFDGLVTDGKAVFPLVNNGFGVARVDAATNEITNRMALGEGEGYGIGKATINDGAVWVLNRNAHFIIAVDLTTLAVKSKTAYPAEYGGEYLAATKESVFINGSDKKALRIDVATPSNQEPKTLAEGANWFTAHDGSLYMTALPEVLSPVLLRLDPVSGAEQSRVAIPYLYSVGRFVFVE